MLQEAGDTEGLQKAAGQLRADRDRYKDFCREKGLSTHNENTQVYGYDRSKSMKTVWAEREHYAKGSLKFDKIVGEKPPTKAMQKLINSEYDSFCNTFGDLKTIRSVSVEKYYGNGVFGSYSDNGGILSIYGAGGKEGIQFLTETAKEHYKSGDWSTSSPMHTLRHEFGHAWQKQLKQTDQNYADKITRIQQKKDDFWKSLTSASESDIMEMQKKTLSLYGLSEKLPIDELISECVAEYANGKPRTFAKEVITILME